MTQQLPAAWAFPFRTLSNVLVVIALAILLDWALASLRGTPTYSCSVGTGLVSDPILASIGMVGLLLGILGISFGGVRHWLALSGTALLAIGLLGLTIATELLQQICNGS